MTDPDRCVSHRWPIASRSCCSSSTDSARTDDAAVVTRETISSYMAPDRSGSRLTGSAMTCIGGSSSRRRG